MATIRCEQAFIDLMGQVRERQAELAGLLDESQWRSLEDANAAPGYRAELEDGYALTRDFGARVKLGKRDVDTGPGAPPTGRTSNAAMNALIRRGS